MKNKLVRLIPLLLLLTLLIAACETNTAPNVPPGDTPPVEDTEPPVNDENEEEEEDDEAGDETPALNYINARISNFDGIPRPAFAFSTHRELVGTGSVNEEGRLELHLSKPEGLNPITEANQEFYSDPSVNIIEISWIHLADPQMWVRSRNAFASDPTEHLLRSVYADRASTVSNSHVEDAVHEMDFQLNPGWNFLRTETREVNGEYTYRTYNSDPELVEWYIVPVE